jgi:serine/threonine protein kinase
MNILDSDENMIDEEKQLSPEEKASLDRFLAEADRIFTLKRYISQGAFNCAHQIDGPEVIRIAYLPGYTLTSEKTGETFHIGGYEKTENYNRRIIRGLEIVHLFNNKEKNFERVIGPSLLRELSPYRVFGERYEKAHFDGQLCEKVRLSQINHRNFIFDFIKDKPNFKVNNRFALQHVEYLNGGQMEYPNIHMAKDYEKEFIAFSLVWFFTMVSQLFGFRHRDLKPDNILLRRTKDYQWFKFNLNNTHYFHFESRLVPVVIDYDFASVNETESTKDRNSYGNQVYRTFESFVIRVYRLLKQKPPLELYQRNIHLDFYRKASVGELTSFEVHQDGYDWWTLGICLLNMYGPDANILFSGESKEYALFMLQKYQDPNWPKVVRDDFKWYCNRIFYSACIASLFSQTGFIIRPPYERYPESSAFFFPFNAPNINMQNHTGFKNMYESVRKALSGRDPVTILLQRLLNWDPLLRNRIDHVLLFSRRAIPAPYENEVYPYEAVLPDDRIHLHNYPGYENLKSCVSCLISSKQAPLYQCECCNRVFCGESCQRENH